MGIVHNVKEIGRGHSVVIIFIETLYLETSDPLPCSILVASHKVVTPTMSDDEETPAASVSAISLKLPPFWPADCLPK